MKRSMLIREMAAIARLDEKSRSRCSKPMPIRYRIAKNICNETTQNMTWEEAKQLGLTK